MHKTVLLKEAVEGLALKEDSVVVDCTLGSGGHASAIIEQLGPKGIYIGIDADRSAVEAAKERFKAVVPQTHFVHANFSKVKSVVEELGLPAPTAILADLGWRSDQFEAGGKGFSFAADEPLLMTYGEPGSYTFTAYDIVNDWEETSIADVIYGYGEERFSRRIAKAIVEARTKQPIKTAKELAEIVRSAVPGFARQGRIHPATKTFQALRIAVNDELGALKTLLNDGFVLLAPAGRMAIITFHSLEDRIVKQFNRDKKHDHLAEMINKKPITAGSEELQENPRARSAKMRIIEKLEQPN